MKSGYLNTIVTRAHGPVLDRAQGNARALPARAQRHESGPAHPPLRLPKQQGQKKTETSGTLTEIGVIQTASLERSSATAVKVPVSVQWKQRRPAEAPVVHPLPPKVSVNAIDLSPTARSLAKHEGPAQETKTAHPRAARSVAISPGTESKVPAGSASYYGPEASGEPALPIPIPPAAVTQNTPGFTPEFRVIWPQAERALPPPMLQQAQRAVERAAKRKWSEQVHSGNVRAGVPPVVDIRVEHLTVKVENQEAASPPAPAPRASSADEGLSAYFLRRSISGL